MYDTHKLALFALSSKTFKISLLEDCRTTGTRATKAFAAAVVANCEECSCLAACCTASANCVKVIQLALIHYSTWFLHSQINLKFRKILLESYEMNYKRWRQFILRFLLILSAFPESFFFNALGFLKIRFEDFSRFLILRYLVEALKEFLEYNGIILEYKRFFRDSCRIHGRFLKTKCLNTSMWMILNWDIIFVTYRFTWWGMTDNGFFFNLQNVFYQLVPAIFTSQLDNLGYRWRPVFLSRSCFLFKFEWIKC